MPADSVSHPAARTFSVVDLVAAALEGRIRIPEFQRPLRWQWQDVQRLFDSIIKGYPIGNLLLWKRSAPAGNVMLGALAVNARSFDEGWWVVDGQQRLTSLANALCLGSEQDDRFALAYDLRDQKFVRPGKQEDGYVIPLPVLFDLQKLIRWFSKDHPEAGEMLDEASRITRAIREYQVPAYLVDKDDEETLRDIFDRMNNYGKRLSMAEVFTALHSGRNDNFTEPVPTFQRIAEAIHAERGFGLLDDDTVMRAVLARRGGNVGRDIRAEFSEHARDARDFGESPTEAYKGGQKALNLAVTFLQEEAGIPHLVFLSYRYLLVVLTRFFAHFPIPQPRNVELLRRWFWRAVMVGPGPFSASYTSAGRMLAARVVPGDENGSIQRLLDEPVNGQWQLPSLTGLRTNSAQGKVIMSALWSLGPRSPLTGEKYERHQLTQVIRPEGTLADIAQRILNREPEGQRAWASNRMLILEEELPEPLVKIITKRQISLLDFQERFLISHALRVKDLEHLESDQRDMFLIGRQAFLQDIVREFLERMTGVSLEDTPPLSSLNLDDLDEDDEDIAD